MQIIENGPTVDATFKLEAGNPDVQIIFESRSGTRGTPAARNAEYERGLEILLERLKHESIHIKTIQLHPGNGEPGSVLQLGVYGPPIPLERIDDMDELRLAIARAQKELGIVVQAHEWAGTRRGGSARSLVEARESPDKYFTGQSPSGSLPQ